jgi:hypothetical protein
VRRCLWPSSSIVWFYTTNYSSKQVQSSPTYTTNTNEISVHRCKFPTSYGTIYISLCRFDIQSTSFRQAGQDIIISSIRLVGIHRLPIDGFACHVLNLAATTRLPNVTRKGPLTNTPILYRTFGVSILVAGHGGAAPIRLTGDCAEVTPSGATEVNANMMGTSIVVIINTMTISCPPSQGHPVRRAHL